MKDNDDNTILYILFIIVLFVVLLICCRNACRTTHPEAIYVENVPENCKVFTLKGTEVIIIR